MDVQGADLTRLRNFDACIQQGEELRVNPFLLRAQYQCCATRCKLVLIQKNAAVRLFDANELVATLPEHQKVSPDARPWNFLDGKPLFRGDGHGLEGLILDHSCIGQAQGFTVEDLTRAAEACKIWHFVHQSGDDNQRTSRSPLHRCLKRRGHRRLRRNKLALWPRGVASRIICILLGNALDSGSLHIDFRLCLNSGETRNVCQPLLRGRGKERRIVAVPQVLHLCTNLRLELFHERGCWLEVPIFKDVQQTGLVLHLFITAVGGVMSSRVNSRTLRQLQQGGCRERLEARKDWVHAVPHFLVLFLQAQERVELSYHQGIRAQEGILG
mmetsp:Transcript_17084/g.39836  ORF Transcript_17084/g.39836 Transcript_17084/m.39836 type:complete len:328 (-) Transcript_17084:485-1468(-)